MRLKKFIVGIALFMIFLIISMPFCFAQELSLSYDANGNLVTGDGKYRTYNSLNQLYRVYNGTGTNGTLLYEFKYHPLEERVLVKKTYNSSGSVVETVYYWSQNFITVVNNSGSYNFTYVYHNGDLVAQQNPDGSKLFVLGDNKGSTSVITNSSGSVLERTTYSPFGEVLSGGRLNRYGYEAKEQELGFGKVPTNGLVSYYALEGGAYDDGVGNQGTVANATLTTGKVRDAYAFNGNSAYVAVNDSNSLDFTGNFTLSAWIKPAKATQGYVVAKYGDYMIQFTGNMTQGGIWNNSAWVVLGQNMTSLNVWTHVVFTYDRNQGKLYLNGALVNNVTYTKTADVNNQILCIGAKNSTDRTRDFNGSIDEVGVWNRALTSDEVTQLYNYGANFDSGFRSTDFEFRRYNPNFGIFEQPDSLISNVFDPQNLNRYMFERGNPYKNKDETGHQACASGECQALYSNPVGWVILGTFFAGYGVYEGGLALREAYPPEEYVYPYIYEYAYAGPRDAWEKLIRKTLKDLEEVADWLKQVAEIAVGNELSRRSSQTTIIGDSGSGAVNPNAMNAAQNANQANPQNGGYTASNTPKVGTEYTTSRGVKTSVERTVSSGGKAIIISKPHESSYVNIRALIS